MAYTTTKFSSVLKAGGHAQDPEIAAFDKDKTDKEAYIKVWAPMKNTAWSVKLICPGSGTVASNSYTTGDGMEQPLMANGRPYID